MSKRTGPETTCRNCGKDVTEHYLANFSDGNMIGANFSVCPSSTFQPADAPPPPAEPSAELCARLQKIVDIGQKWSLPQVEHEPIDKTCADAIAALDARDREIERLRNSIEYTAYVGASTERDHYKARAAELEQDAAEHNAGWIEFLDICDKAMEDIPLGDLAGKQPDAVTTILKNLGLARCVCEQRTTLLAARKEGER